MIQILQFRSYVRLVFGDVSPVAWLEDSEPQVIELAKRSVEVTNGQSRSDCGIYV